MRSGNVGHQKYPSCFFFSMESRLVVVDHAALLFRCRRQQHFLDDRGQRVRVALHRTGQWVAAERANNGTFFSIGFSPARKGRRSSSTMISVPSR